MDPGEQPYVLQQLTQVEEMLIARVNPILQVTHARGGQYKYSGHTISFPQDITTIAKYLPRMISDLDILIVKRQNPSEKAYEFFVCKSRVLAALEYKTKNDPYYCDVQFNSSAISALPDHPTDISSLLRNVTTSSFEPHQTNIDSTYDTDVMLPPLEIQPSSFVPILPNSNTELEHICNYLHLTQSNSTSSIDWPPISLTAMNEYNTIGLFSMAFPTLFPTGIAMIMQPRLTKVEMHEYALHLLHYHDNRFGQHPRFRYYLYNILMRHHSQTTASVFVKKYIENNLPTTVSDLRQCLRDSPDSRLPKQIMRFGSALRGTRSFWNRRRSELTDMITQIGSPTFFFTLSAADTKWHDLHMIMPDSVPSNSVNHFQWKIQNIIKIPHLTAQYMHCRFTIFLEEILQKGLHAVDYWCRYFLISISFYINFLHCIYMF